MAVSRLHAAVSKAERTVAVDIFKRLYKIAKSYADSTIDLIKNRKGVNNTTDFYENIYKPENFNQYTSSLHKKTVDPVLAEYYANLEVPYGSDMELVRASWKRLLKKYHPDMHSNDIEKKRIATILTQKLNEAYRAVEKAKKEGKV